jgi:two-component sensor histidine kinase
MSRTKTVGGYALGIAIVFSLAFLALSSLALYSFEYQRRSSAAENEIAVLYSAQSPGMAEGLWNYDDRLLQVLADGMRFYPYISYVSISDQKDSLVSSGQRKAGSATRDYALLRTFPDGTAENLGTLSIEIDSSHIRRDTVSQVLVSLSLQLLFLVLESLIILSLFSRLVTRHLAKIAAYIRVYGASPGAPLLILGKKERGDELDILVSSFNAMRSNLEASRVSEIKAREEVARSLREKEVLLQEVYHRTKNNMQLIASFLSMEAIESGSERVSALVDEMIGRITSMALVHQKLYESKDLSRIDFGDYARDLIAEIKGSYLGNRGQIELRVEAQAGIVVVLDTAIPCGLALNELVVNAIKHAFPAGRAGIVRVALERGAQGGFLFSVADDGVGLPPGFDLRRDARIGLRTVVSVIEEQLRGEVRLAPRLDGTGTLCTATVRDDLYSARI